MNTLEKSRPILPGGITGFWGRRWMLILVPLILMPFVSYFKAIQETPVFQTTVRLLVQESNLRSPLLDNYVLDLDLDAQLKTLETIALKPRILELVRRKTDQELNENLPDNLEDLLEIHISSDKTITLKAKGSRPESVQDLADAFSKVCIGELNRPRVEASEKIMEFLATEFDQAQANLNQSHQRLSGYRASHGKVMPELEQITYNLLLTLEAEQIQLDARAHALTEKRTQLEADPAVRGKTVAGLEDQILHLGREIESISRRVTDNHPDLQIMRSRLNRLKLDHSLRSQGLVPPGNQGKPSKSEEEYNLLLIEQNALSERIVQVSQRVLELQAKIASASNHDAEYVRRLRDVESHTEIYLDLLRRRERAATSQNLVLTNNGDLVQVIQPATLPTKPNSPRPMQELIIGIVSGLIIGLGLAIGSEMSDKRVFGSRNLECAMGAPVLLELQENR